MPPQLPRRRPDGSFSVQFDLQVDTPSPADFVVRLHDWFDEWVVVHRFWSWNGAKDQGGIVDYFAEFAAPPRATIGPAGTVTVRVDGLAKAKLWKDVLTVRILKELPNEFREVRSISPIVDAPDEELLRTTP